MTVEEFLGQYQETLRELTECEEKLRELEYPQRGNRIGNGDHAGISNQPEEYTILKDRLQAKKNKLQKQLPRQKRKVEAFLNKLKPRQAKILRRKYIDGLNTLELASWMHVTQKSAIAAVRFAMSAAEKEYNVFCALK